MKTRILTLLFLSLCCICGAMNVDAQPRAPKFHYKPVQTPPPPPFKPGKKVPLPKIFNPVGHVYSLSVPGHKIIFNFNTNGRVYREGDKFGSPFTINGNLITVYSSQGPRRVIGTGKISRDGRYIDWMELLNGSKYRLRLIG